MILLLSILIGAAIGSHPALAVLAIVYAACRLHASEALISCCSCVSARKLIVFGRVIG